MNWSKLVNYLQNSRSQLLYKIINTNLQIILTTSNQVEYEQGSNKLTETPSEITPTSIKDEPNSVYHMDFLNTIQKVFHNLFLISNFLISFNLD